jgi:GNAT superfamily N-acetyltransferase
VPPSLRPLTAADVPVLWTALYHAVHVPPGAPPPPSGVVRLPELARYVDGWAGRAGDLGVVAEAAGGPVGAAWLRLWTGADRGYGFVNADTPELTMAVLPGHRGRGVGTALLRRLLAEAAGRFGAVSLSVARTNPVRRLYEREGFEPVGPPREGAVTMIRRLPTGPGGAPAGA